MNNRIIIASILAVAAFTSCQKKETETINNNDLTVSINKPTAAQVFNSGDTIFIAAKGAFTSEMHGYSLKINNTTSNETLFEIEEHLHSATVELDTFFVSNAASAGDLQLSFTIEADHNGNEKTATVNFQTIH